MGDVEQVHSSIREFAKFIGTTAQIEHDGSCAFRFSQSGLLSMISSPDGRDLVLTLSRPQSSGLIDFEKALKAGANDLDQERHLISVGINKASEVVVSMRLRHTQVSFQSLLAALDLLKKRQQEIMS